MSEEFLSPSNFSGLARLFPLPNLVFFPHVVQPLHIFEPRYRQLMIDALAEDRLMTLAVPQPGWEENYHKKPPIYPIVTVGRIHHEEQLPDHRWNLLLQGLSRARVLEEVPTDRLYRIARVELVHDIPVGSAERERPLRQGLDVGLAQLFSDQPLTLVQLRQLMATPASLGKLCDILGFALPLPFELKQQMLEELDCERRAHLLLEQLNVSPHGKKWPPEFSTN